MDGDICVFRPLYDCLTEMPRLDQLEIRPPVVAISRAAAKNFRPETYELLTALFSKHALDALRSKLTGRLTVVF